MSKLEQLQAMVNAGITLSAEQQTELDNLLKEVKTSNIVISETVVNALKERQIKPLASAKTADIVGKQGKITNVRLTIIEGEAWELKRKSIQDNYPTKDLTFMNADSYNVNGSIDIEDVNKKINSYYVNNDLLAMLLKKNVLIESTGGYLLSDKTFKFEATDIKQLN